MRVILACAFMGVAVGVAIASAAALLVELAFRHWRTAVISALTCAVATPLAVIGHNLLDMATALATHP